MSENETGERTEFTQGSGNVFADIGLPEPEAALAKAHLAEAITEAVERRGTTREEAGEVMGVDQPTVSKIARGRLRGFTQDRLTRYLTALGDDVEIRVRQGDKEGDAGRLYL